MPPSLGRNLSIEREMARLERARREAVWRERVAAASDLAASLLKDGAVAAGWARLGAAGEAGLARLSSALADFLAAKGAPASEPGAGEAKAEAQRKADAALSQAASLGVDVKPLAKALAKAVAEPAAPALPAAVRASVAGVKAMLAATSTVAATDWKGGELAVVLDVDWWSKGKLAAIREAFAAIECGLAGAGASQLKQWRAADLPGLQAGIQAVVAEARHEALMAQARRDFGVVVADTFERLGFDVSAIDYRSGDARGDFFLKAVGPSDSDVTVIVTQADQPDAVFVNVHSFDADQKPDFVIERRVAAIGQAIRDTGVKINLSASVGSADLSLRSVEALAGTRSSAA